MDHFNHFQLGPAALHFPLNELPQGLKTELGQQAHSANYWVGQLVAAYGYQLDAGQVVCHDSLMMSMRRHMTSLAEAFMRYVRQGVAPIYYYNDLQPGDRFFIVDRAAVFQSPDNNQLMAPMADFELYVYHGPHVIAARHQLLTLIRDLIRVLRSGPVLEQVPAAVIQDREEAMLVAATNYMQALQMMSILAMRITESFFAFDAL
ncbi:hypothetical protein TYRP_016924 [Tyrophagus putrescentiae]|nr:hypothetical protein TYRP_016924 [Tyrophagus putrescentiae]